MAIDYTQSIPNNVDLHSDRRLQRALENWQPRFLDWWKDMGPDGALNFDVYLRTAISAEANGWANFGYVKMPDYRWGIFLAGQDPNRVIAYGDNKGKPVWQEVPGELRSTLRRLIVTQGDTEPASVEQQRLLGKTAPSLYDLRNLFQINCEEGRHLWAMVYLLHAYFGRDGREEAEMLLERHSGDVDKPRILGAFNEKTPDWLSFFMFTYFTDRDGKYQLGSLAESAFDPLARTCDFMLIEEAHHMFVGKSASAHRAADLRADEGPRDRRPPYPGRHRPADPAAVPELPLLGIARPVRPGGVHERRQLLRLGRERTLTETATRTTTCSPATARPRRRRRRRLRAQDVPGAVGFERAAAHDYVEDCHKGLLRWNRVMERAGIAFELKLPHRAFNRRIGAFAELRVSPEGKVMSEADWKAAERKWLPTAEDRTYVTSLMGPAVIEPGKFANWIAPPQRGINGQPADFEYVRFN